MYVIIKSPFWSVCPCMHARWWAVIVSYCVCSRELDLERACVSVCVYVIKSPFWSVCNLHCTHACTVVGTLLLATVCVGSVHA